MVWNGENGEDSEDLIKRFKYSSHTQSG